MRCKNCDYRLWNLRSRNCPECGTPFRVSDYEFALNSVQFCCPHCGQDYYGTGERGHLRPFEFDCVRCKQRVNMDEMVLLPTAGVEEAQTQTERMPWFDESIGGFKRWTGTLLMALTRPADMMRLTPAESTAGAAWRFFLVTWLIVFVGATGLFCALPAIFLGGMRGATFSGLGGMGVAMVVGMALLLFCGLVWSLLTHLILRATGPTSGGFGRTQQAMFYSSGANIITGIPCLGVYVGWIWWAISAVLATREAQRVSGFRASVAVISPLLIAIAGVVGFYVWLFSQAAFTARATAVWPTSFPTNGPAGTFATAIQKYAETHSGAMPKHPAELLQVDEALSALDFVQTGGTDPMSVLIADVPLDEFDGVDPRKQRQALEKLAANAATPAPVIQRFGDFIFTFGGIELAKATPDTWLVVGVHPFNNGGSAAGPYGGGVAGPQAQTWLEIGTVAGPSSTIMVTDVGALVDQQNRTRAEVGLPQIPRDEFIAATQGKTATLTTPTTTPSEDGDPQP